MTVCWHRSGSKLAQVMVCCLMAWSHYMKQYWLTINNVLRHSFQINVYLYMLKLTFCYLPTDPLIFVVLLSRVSPAYEDISALWRYLRCGCVITPHTYSGMSWLIHVSNTSFRQTYPSPIHHHPSFSRIIIQTWGPFHKGFMSSLSKPHQDQVTILYMSWRLSCHDMCKIVTSFVHQNHSRENFHISVMSSQNLFEICPRTSMASHSRWHFQTQFLSNKI